MEDKYEVTQELQPFGVMGLEEINIPLKQAIADLKETLQSIPAKFRDTAVLSIHGYGDHLSIYTHVKFTRPETPGETTRRQRRNAIYLAHRNEEERVVYERLKAKFG